MRPRPVATLILGLAASGSFALDVVFKNVGKEPLTLFWVDHTGNGKMKKVSKIPSGKNHSMDATHGHMYSLKADKAVKGATPLPARVMIQNPGNLRCKVAKNKDGKRQVQCVFQDPGDYYQVLGLNEDASDNMIKKAYRVLSVKYHPDKNPGHEKMFNAVRDAYEVLSDTENRLIYDMGGKVLLWDRENLQSGTSEDEEEQMNITLREAYIGVDKTLEIKRRLVCRGCADNPQIRPSCAQCVKCPDGIRHERANHQGMWYMMEVPVPSTEMCRVVNESLPIRIEKGMSQFNIVDFRHMASQTPNRLPGHIHVGLEEILTPPFVERLGSSLVVPVEITVREALLGWERSITHLDGHIVRVKVTEVSRPGDIIVIKGEGMPVKDVPEDFGDLRLKLSVVFPSALTSADKEEVAAVSVLKRDSVKQDL